MEEHEAALVLAAARGVGPAAAARLRAAYGSYAAVIAAARAGGRTRIPPRLAAAIRDSLGSGEAGRRLESAGAGGARFAVPGDDDYTESLAAIAGPPIGIYVAGRGLASLLPALAVVGTRTATRRGLAVARDLAFDVASAGLTVVSGLARGIDTAAHEGALEAGGTTVAVLGTGLARVYPEENARLAERIREAGALVSEYEMQAGPRPGSFPARNRLIAGLSSGVLVVEAGQRSGALITSSFALEEGREIFAVPGPITEPLSAGPNGLIKAGAKLVEGVEDILEELTGIREATGPAAAPGVPGAGPRPARAPAGRGAGRAQAGAREGEPSRVLAALKAEPLSIDELCEATGLAPADVASSLLELEIAGSASACPGGRYARSERRSLERSAYAR